MFEEFWDKCFDNAIKLKERFKFIEEKNWDALTIMNEFIIQLGHYSMLVSGQDIAKEEGRNIVDHADELSDILLQSCAFCNFIKIRKEDIIFKEMKCQDEKIAVMNITSLAGQIIETLLEEDGYRFKKPRKGFFNKKDFIVDKITKIFSIIFSIIEYRGIDIIKEFNSMCENANNFIDKRISQYKFPIVDLHASWIALNPIQGCPNSCKYCFLNGVNLTKRKPKVLATVEETVDQLLKSEFYHPDIPICIETETDGFATPDNIKYIENLLNELDRNNINNIIVFITKCYIPKNFMIKVKELEKKNHKFLFFLSYSGLDNDIEIGINKEHIKRNFIQLTKMNLPVIHYWRPFLPENSTKEKIMEVYNFVKKYALCSVAIGLKVKENYKDKLDFWKEIQDIKETTCAESVWTKNAYEYIWGDKVIIDKDYPIFKTTSCAIAYATNQSEQEACFKSNVCINDNRCPEKQRELCRKYYSKLKKVDENYVRDILLKLKLINKDTKYDIRVNNELKSIDIQGVELTTKEFSLLTLLTKYKVKANKSNSDYYWNSFINDTKQIII